MIRVLQVLDGLGIGGAETMIMNIYRAVDKNKVQFDFIIHESELQHFENEAKSYGSIIYRFPSPRENNIFYIKKYWNVFFEKHPEYRILHSHIRSFATIFIPVAKKHGVVTIVHSHSTSNGNNFVGILKNIMQFPLRFQADYLFACSIASGIWLFGKKSIEKSNFYIIKNAVDASKYQFNKETRLKYRKNLGVENCRTYIHIGRFHESKNHEFLIKIFAEWIKNHPNDKLLLVGDGELKDKIVSEIYSLNLNNNIIALGARIDIANLLQAADCFIFPSKWEGLPVSVIEAQASGIPCLISDKITNEVFITQQAIAVPIDNGIKPWIEKMEKIDYSRADTTEQIVSSGFDIWEMVSWLQNFYLGISKK